MTAHAARTSRIRRCRSTLADLVAPARGRRGAAADGAAHSRGDEGGHVSPYKGRGVEFDESRPYQPGDDLRTMDWRVTARTGKPHTKVFREERNRPVFVWLDLRRPMLFATRGAFKAVRAAEMAALIAWSASRTATGSAASSSPRPSTTSSGPRSARARRCGCCRPCAAESLVAAAGDGRDRRDRRRARAAAAHARRAARQPDLPAQRLSPARRGLRAPPAQLAGHCDLLLVHCYDAVEAELPPPGRYRIQGVGRSFSIETANEATRRRYHERFAARRAALEALCRGPGIRMVDCATDADPRSVLNQKFRSR